MQSESTVAVASEEGIDHADGGRRQLSVVQISNKLYAAIVEHRLPPGTRLGEERLSEIFSVNRARIRQVLARLASQQVVEIVPHRGAHVFKPSVEDAREIFEARRVIEPFNIRKLISVMNVETIARLKAQSIEELNARNRDDQPAIVRLSGEFHVLLAELAGNSPLRRATRELATQTCLIISLYSQSTILSCRADEHANIVEAIVHRDADRAVRLLLEHLDHIERSLILDRDGTEIDLEQVFAET